MSVLINLLGLLGTGVMIVSMLYFRTRRADIMAKYKPNTSEFKMFMKLMDMKRIIATIAIFIFFLGSLIWQIITTPPDAKSSPLFVTILFISLCLVTFLAVYGKVRPDIEAARKIRTKK